MRCWAVYFLAGGDQDHSLYPFECWPIANGLTCDSAVSLDFDPAQTITVPAGETRWWKDSQPLTGPVSVQGSNYGTDSWTATAWVGPDCANLTNQGVLDNWNPSASGTVSAGESLWLEVSSAAGATLDLRAFY